MYDIKLICSQNIFILTCNVKLNIQKKNLSYKPTQKWHVSCVVLGKGFLLWHPWLFDHVFTPSIW
jgi:hypothetical protein